MDGLKGKCQTGIYILYVYIVIANRIVIVNASRIKSKYIFYLNMPLGLMSVADG